MKSSENEIGEIVCSYCQLVCYIREIVCSYFQLVCYKQYVLSKKPAELTCSKYLRLGSEVVQR